MVRYSCQYRLWSRIFIGTRIESSKFNDDIKFLFISTERIIKNLFYYKIQFIEKFQEVKEATRIAQQKALQPNGNISNTGATAAVAVNHSMSARDSPRLSSQYQNDILMSSNLFYIIIHYEPNTNKLFSLLFIFFLLLVFGFQLPKKFSNYFQNHYCLINEAKVYRVFKPK